MTKPVAEVIEDFKELKRHCAIVPLSQEQVVRMLRLGSPDYVVISVDANWARRTIDVLVAHPDLPTVPEGVEAPILHAAVGLFTDYKVIDGEIWERSKLTIDDPEVQASLEG